MILSRKFIFLPTFLIILVCLSTLVYARMLDDGVDKKVSCVSLLNARNNNIGTAQNNSLSAASKKPEYCPNEVIVKLKAKASPTTLYSMAYSQRQSMDANVLDNLKAKYGLKNEQPVFKALHEQLKSANMSQAQLEKKISIKLLKKSLLKGTAKAKQSGQFVDLLPIYILNTDEDAQTVSDRLKQDPDVEYAEPNYIMHAQIIPNDPYYNSSGTWGQPYDDLWGVKKIRCGQAWDISQGEGVVVAVIDTGVDYTHEDLAQNIWTNTDEIAGNGIDDDNNGYIDDVNGWDFTSGSNDPMDRFGHGTHCAGTIAAIGNNSIGVIGVAPKVKIMPVKGLDDTGSGSIDNLAACVKYAADNGANVLSCSWGGTGVSSVLTDAFHYADSKGCVCIAAAGNDNADAGASMPANIDTVIAVAAVDNNDKKAFFSNYGAKVDVSAPGVDILSCYPHALSGTVSNALITVNSDANKKLGSNVLVFSAALPSGGLSGQILYANLGYPADFQGKDFSNKIALIRRGEIYFMDKVSNAYAAGAIGVIIYNNVSGNFNGTLEILSSIPAVSITMEDGAYLTSLQAATTVTINPVNLGNYYTMMGTSMACPHVAGLAALLMSKYPDDLPGAILSRISAGADNIDSLNPGFEGWLGAGRINAFNSLANVSAGPAIKIIEITHHMEPGMTSNVRLSLKNFWLDAFGVTAVLSTDNPGVTIQNNNAAFGDILSGQTVENDGQPFIVSLGNGIKYGDAISFNVTLTTQAGYTQTLNFSVIISFFVDVGSLTNLPMNDTIPVYTAMGDYNGDSYADLFFIGYDGVRSTAGLYKNCQNGSFVDATDEARIIGLDHPSASIFMDINNDGNEDLFIAGYFGSKLFLNNGDGTFTDISQGSGVENAHLSSAIAVDYNNDGFLDIVGRLNDDSSTNKGKVLLLKNNGDNTFTDVTANSGLSQIDIPLGGGVVSLDYNNDGNEDLLFASPNPVYKTKLCRNNGDGTFTDVSVQTGIGIVYRWDEGFAVGDYNNDGYIDILLTGCVDTEGNGVPITTLYKNNGDGTFTDATVESGNFVSGQAGTWWGNDFFDYDNDGYLDIYMTSELYAAVLKNMLYRNNGDGTFTSVTDTAFPRGVTPNCGVAAIGDYDNDGAMDIYAPVSEYGVLGAFLKNAIGTNNNYIKIRLVGTVSNRDAIGTKIYLRVAANTQLRELHTSPVETQPVHFGLGKAPLIDEIDVHWPSGIIQRLSGINANQLLTITEPNISMPRITSINPNATGVGGLVTISGKNFGLTQGAGFVTFFNVQRAVIQSWSDTQIVCLVPDGAVSGDVYVNIGSNKSNGVYFTLLTVPIAPSDLKAGGAEYSRLISLNWQGHSDNENGFRIERSLNGTSFSQIATVSAGTITYADNTISLGQDYFYRVCAYNNLGNSAYTNIVVSPAPPQNLQCTVMSAGRVSLQWNDKSDNESGYKILRATGLFGELAIIDTLPANATSYSDTTANLGTTYSYEVCAYTNSGGNAYTFSKTASVLLPGAPQNLRTTSILQNQINLQWVGPPFGNTTGNATGFKIERSVDGSSFAEIGSVTNAILNYNDTGLTSGTRYWYKVRSYNNVGDSGYSNVICAITEGPPPQPSQFSANVITSTQVSLSWQDNSNAETGFKVERSLDGIAFTQQATVAANIVNYIDSGLAAGTTYYYRVCSYNDAGNSPYSNIVSVMLSDHPPVLNPIGNKTIDMNKILSFIVSATDPDNDPLTYSVSGLPQGAAFNPATQTFRWTPSYNQVGSYQVTFTVSDGMLSASQTITITVTGALPGDANLDGVVGAADLSILLSHYGKPGNWSQGDFNGDGTVGLADLSILLSNYGHSIRLPGDANLDGSVGLADLNIVLSHYGKPGNWSQGDFNGDGTVGAADLNILLSNYGRKR